MKYKRIMNEIKHIEKCNENNEQPEINNLMAKIK